MSSLIMPLVCVWLTRKPNRLFERLFGQGFRKIHLCHMKSLVGPKVLPRRHAPSNRITMQQIVRRVRGRDSGRTLNLRVTRPRTARAVFMCNGAGMQWGGRTATAPRAPDVGRSGCDAWSNCAKRCDGRGPMMVESRKEGRTCEAEG